MFSVNVTCGVCKSNFKNTDSNVSTSCGHIFHLKCINQTTSRLNSCPVCKTPNPNSHPIYLNFENSREYENVVNDLNAKLQISADNIKNILVQNDKKDRKIDEFKRLYNVSEQWRAGLEDKIRKLSKELQLQKEIQSNEMTLKLEEGQENDAQTLLKKIEDLNAENSKLAKNLKDTEASKMILNYKIEIQEKRLKHMAKELEKEIAECLRYKIKQGPYFKENNLQLEKETDVKRLYEKIDELSAENLKLAKNLKDTESSNMILNHKITIQEQRLKHVAKELDKEIAEGLNHRFSQESRENINKVPSQKPTDFNRRNKKRSNSNRQVKDSTNKSSFGDCKIIITNVPKSVILHPLEDTIIFLASKMIISLTKEDIVRVTKIDRMRLSDKVVLTVEFKTIASKILFLENRNRVKLDALTKDVVIKEYIDETIYPVFMYANRKLRGNGYEFVCCRNNQVIAKKKINDIAEIVIKNQADVDSLIAAQSNDTIMESMRSERERCSSPVYSPSSPSYSFPSISSSRPGSPPYGPTSPIYSSTIFE